MDGLTATFHRPGLVVALDVPSLADALALARAVEAETDLFKVGLELFWRDGLAAIDDVAVLGAPVFADTKLHDIPRTVEAAAHNLARLPITMFTVHTAGGREMCEAAVEGAQSGADAARRPRPLVIGVTLLTSQDSTSLRATGVTSSPEDLVRSRCELAAESGLDGIVCAPTDLSSLSDLGTDLVRVVPGIRPFPVTDDQRRVATVDEALDGGADLLVVGRPVTAADDPRAAAAEISARVIARREMAG